MQWGQQRQFMMTSWNVGWFIGTLFVIVNLLGQLVPCGMILAKKKTDIACGILVFIITLQVSEMTLQFQWEKCFVSSPLPIESSGNRVSYFGKRRESTLVWITSNIWTSLPLSLQIVFSDRWSDSADGGKS